MDLITFINNYKNRVSGPIDYTLLDNREFDRQILILGSQHTNKGLCYEGDFKVINEFLIDIANGLDKPLHFYSENSFVSEIRKKNIDFSERWYEIDRTYKSFDTDKLVYRDLPIEDSGSINYQSDKIVSHFSDLRRNFSDILNFKELLNEFYKNRISKENIREYLENTSWFNLDAVFKKLLEVTEYVYTRDFRCFIDHYTLNNIERQLSKIDLKYQQKIMDEVDRNKNEIEFDYFNRCYIPRVEVFLTKLTNLGVYYGRLDVIEKDKFAKYKDLIEFLEKTQGKYGETDIDYLYFLADVLLYGINSQMLDHYFMARIHRDFEDNPQRYAVLFAGDDHCSNILRMLINLGYQVVKEDFTSINTLRCIEFNKTYHKKDLENGLKELDLKNLNGPESFEGLKKDGKEVLLIGTCHGKVFSDRSRCFFVSLKNYTDYKILFEDRINFSERQELRLNPYTDPKDLILLTISYFDGYKQFTGDIEGVDIRNNSLRDLFALNANLDNLINIKNNSKSIKIVTTHELTDFAIRSGILNDERFSFDLIKKHFEIIKEIIDNNNLDTLKKYFPEQKITEKTVVDIKEKKYKKQIIDLMLSTYSKNFKKIKKIVNSKEFLIKYRLVISINRGTIKDFLLGKPSLGDYQRLKLIVSTLCDIYVRYIGNNFVDFYSCVKILESKKPVVYVAENAHVEKVKSMLISIGFNRF